MEQYILGHDLITTLVLLFFIPFTRFFSISLVSISVSIYQQQTSQKHIIIKTQENKRIMSANSARSSSVDSSLLAEVEEDGHEEEAAAGEREDRWWKKVLDLEEAKNQVLYSLPMILTNVSYYMIPVVSVMFAGHLGDLELAGSNLANSWATVTGYAFMVSLSLAM